MRVIGWIRAHWAIARAALEAERDGKAKAGPQAIETQFLPAVLEVTETPASPAGRALAISLSAFFVIALGWAIVGEIDVMATAQGKTVSSGRDKLIQPVETGTVRAIHVTDGDRVRAGDLLVELDPTQVLADVERLAADHLARDLEVARLRALLSDDPGSTFQPPAEATPEQVSLHRAFLESEWGNHRAEVARVLAEIDQRSAEAVSLRAEIRRAERILPNIRERVNSTRRLVDREISPRLAFLELEQELIDAEQNLEVQASRLKEVEAATEALRQQQAQLQAQFRQNALAQLNEAETTRSQIAKELAKAEERLRLTRLTAPVDGFVQQLAVHTVGGVVTPAQELMVIVPADAALEAEAMIQNMDVGFVEAGQPAEIKVESFPFTRYGIVPGTVAHLSRNAISDENLGLVYPARILLDRTTIEDGDRTVNLGPGMALTVEIKTGKRRIIEYVLSPVLKYASESFRER